MTARILGALLAFLIILVIGYWSVTVVYIPVREVVVEPLKEVL